jgi:uncharacterized protein YcbK (DUF882 family)
MTARAVTLAFAAAIFAASASPAIPLAPLAGKTHGLQPKLVKRLTSMAAHFGRTVVVTSGCRSRSHNLAVRGAKRSMHLRCAAADVRLKGVPAAKIVAYWRANGGGGTGTYCSGSPPHVDIGPSRSWQYGCRKKGKRR